MIDEPVTPESDEVAEEDEDLDDGPEVEGFMQMPSLGGVGSILPPIKPTLPPTGPAGPGTGGTGGTGGSGGSGGTPGTVSFPRPS